MMKKGLFFLFFLYSALGFSAEKLTLSTAAEGAILINATTGAILYEKNADKPLFPASITKVATALYVLKKYGNRLDEVVKAKREAIASITPEAKRQSNYRSPPYWLETDGNHIGIKNGEEFQLKDLLHAMLITSANDAANVIAEHFGGTIPKFVEDMNSYLKKIGCTKTHFLNPHGFHHPDQVSSPRDMAIIARCAMQEPLFAEIVAKTRYTIPRTNLEFERNLLQTNLLLRKGRYYYPKAIGVKTGTTVAAGKALIAAAKDEKRLLIAVVMGCQKMGERYEDAIKMFESAFLQPKMRKTLLPKGPQSITKTLIGAKGDLKTYLPDGLYYDFYPAEEVKVKAHVKWLIPKLPINKGQCVGIVRVVDSYGTVLQETALLSQEKISPTIFYRFKSSFEKGKTGRKVLFIGGAGLAFLIFIKVRSRRRKSNSRFL